jgi:hypothetical protein
MMSTLEITATPTARIVEVNGQPARIWSGVTSSGEPLILHVAAVACRTKEGQAELERHLQEIPEPVQKIEQEDQVALLLCLMIFARDMVLEDMLDVEVGDSEAQSICTYLHGYICALTGANPLYVREHFERTKTCLARLMLDAPNFSKLIVECEQISNGGAR